MPLSIQEKRYSWKETVSKCEESQRKLKEMILMYREMPWYTQEKRWADVKNDFCIVK